MNPLLETNMNTLLETIASNLLRLGFVPWFFGVGLQSVAVLAAAGGLCLLLRRAAAATRHWIWFLAVASLPCLMLLAMAPPVWQKPLWGVATDLNSGNQFSLTLLCLSTVYCRYHYVVDVLAGLVTAAVVIPLCNWLYFRFSRPAPTDATPASGPSPIAQKP